MSRQTSKKAPKDKNRIAEFYKLSSMVMSKVGIIGFVCISMVSYVFFFVPQTLKDELTKTWLLFKCQECSYAYIILIISVGLLFIFQNYFYRRALKLKDQRIREITKEKSELQERLLNKKLNSTQEPK